MGTSEETNGKHRTIPSIGVRAQTILKRLLVAEVGDVVTYEELARLVGVSVQYGSGYSSATTARNRAFEDQGILFEPVEGVGLKRCNDTEKVDAGSRSLQQIRRMARRGAKKLASVDNYNEMPKDFQVQHNVSMSVLAAIQHNTTSKTIKAIESKVQDARQVLPKEQLLEVLKNV